MSRFDATARTDRHELIVASVKAHRERESAFCTFEADAADVPDADELGVPWVQCSGNETAIDCTPAELDRVKQLLDSYPHYRIEDIHRPAETMGAHVVLTTPGELDRRAQFVDGLFVSAFELDMDYRLWAVEV